MPYWLAHLEFELGDRVRFPGSIPLGKLFTHTASPVSQLEETGAQKGVFGA